MTALGFLRKPKVVDVSLAYVLAGPLRPQEIKSIPEIIAKYARHQCRVLEWLMKNYDELAGHIPEMHTASLQRFASGCSAQRLYLFNDSSQIATGTDEELAKASDQVTDCISPRERQGSAVSTYLRRLATKETPF